jgi:hypothetical protein
LVDIAIFSEYLLAWPIFQYFNINIFFPKRGSGERMRELAPRRVRSFDTPEMNRGAIVQHQIHDMELDR